MGDSDDDYERRRRDKFRGERSEYGGSRERRDDSRRREDWPERSREGWGGRERGMSRRDYGRDYGRSRERYSPTRHDMSPPLKRMRPDWEERRYPYDTSYPVGYASYGHDYGHPPPHGAPGMPAGRFDDLGPTQPPMMSFKAFMEQCEDSISEEEALRKYSDYKLEFKRQQLNEFFVNHKEEEWFKAKYHPEECVKRKDEQLANLKRRVCVFMELKELGRIYSVTVDADQSDQLLKLLDSVVIKLEGGTDLDLQILDLPTEEEQTHMSLTPVAANSQDDDNKQTVIVGEDSDVELKGEKSEKDAAVEEELELQKKAKEYLIQKPVEGNGEVPSRKRKRSESSSSESSSSSSESGEEEEPAAPGEEEKTEPPPPGMEEGKEPSSPKDPGLEDENPVDEEQDGKQTKEHEEKEGPKPRPLHKTASIFLRNLAPTITKAEVEAMCRRYNGFLRAAIADPQPERRWFRRGWVTFKRDVNIKDICWNLNNIRLRDCELGAIVNRDLSRRIRTVNGITSHRAVVKADIKLAAKIIQNLDSRWYLWKNQANGQDITNPPSLSSSGNPVLRNITDYLIEEASAEEEELLGANNDATGTNGEDKSDGETIERDPVLISVLDCLLLYLRIVHSVDYYNHSEYPNEDEMPNRCGIMHARGIPPSSKVTPQEVQDYCRTFENKIGSFLQPLTKLSEDEAKKLGLKEGDEEVEKFIQANTQEVAKDKWQCPLCGKKFKAAEFVHKHILNKHAEKVKEVQKEVDYFNNYLRDPKRPQLPEYPGNKQMPGRKEDLGRPDQYVAAYPQQTAMYSYGNYTSRYQSSAPYGAYSSAYPKDYYGRDTYMRDAYPRPRATYRSRVGYRDLDAPKEEY